jgi:hypothetical protein
MQTATLVVDSADLDLQAAQDLARQKAREINPDAMLLAWYDARTDTGYPNTECGDGSQPPWELFARSRGGNLTIDINDGIYTFIYLKL